LISIKKLLTSTLLLSFYFISIMNLTRIFVECNEKNNKVEKSQQIRNVLTQLQNLCSFAYIADAKFIGLFIFLLSNVLTGIVNLTVQTLYSDYYQSFNICAIYCLLSFGLPFAYYYNKNIKDQFKESLKQN
jgi:hypothetical protein